MEAKAVKRYIQTSPRKMRIVADLIRGKSVEDALNILHFSPKHASNVIASTLKSAVSNYSNRSETGKIDEKNLYVKTVFVDGGGMLKRMLPAPQGRAFRIRKRSNHLTVVIAELEPSNKE
jgi:large subunit ribosomal protein L22